MKSVEGAKCGGYTRGEEPCYRGECVGGRCVLSPGGTPRPRTTPRPTPGGTLQRTETCYNENKCCQNWAARGQCNLNPDYMRRTCPASCESCTPTRYRLADGIFEIIMKLKDRMQIFAIFKTATIGWVNVGHGLLEVIAREISSGWRRTVGNLVISVHRREHRSAAQKVFPLIQTNWLKAL